MFELKWTKEADGQYKELRAKAQKSLANRKAKKRKKSSKAEGLFKQVRKTIKLVAPTRSRLHFGYGSTIHTFTTGCNEAVQVSSTEKTDLRKLS